MSIALSQCQYGNYVMQHIVTKCKEERKKVFDNFLGHVVDLSTNKYASWHVVRLPFTSSGSPVAARSWWHDKSTNWGHGPMGPLCR